MPINASQEYFVAERRFHEAKTNLEKLAALKNMLSKAPTHKGAENLRGDIKKKIAQMKKDMTSEKSVKKSRPSLAIKKEGAAQIAIIGLPNSGKSTLLTLLSGSEVPVAEYAFTTKDPVVKMMPFENVQLQGIEIPAIYKGFYDSPNGKQLCALVHGADFILVVGEVEDMRIIIRELDKAGVKLSSKRRYYKGFTQYVPSIRVNKDNFSKDIPKKIWAKLNLIRVQTKTKQGVAPKPVILKVGSTVENLARTVHKDFVAKLRYAKVWGPSAKFEGQSVGLEHKLKDRDIVEIFLK